MSGNTASGGALRRSSRLVISAAVLTALIMLALPVSVSCGADAIFGDSDAGYVMEISNGATDDELAYFDFSRAELARNAVNMALPLDFSYTWMYLSDISEFSASSIYVMEGSGDVLTGDRETFQSVDSAEFKDFTFKLTITNESASKIFYDEQGYQELTDAANAVIDLFETNQFSTGDAIVFSGSVTYKCVSEDVTTYSKVNDSKCAPVSYASETHVEESYSITMTYTSPVFEGSRVVKFEGDVDADMQIDRAFSYKTPMDQVKQGDEVDVTNYPEYSYGDSKATMTIGDDKHSLMPATLPGTTAYKWSAMLQDNSRKANVDYPLHTNSTDNVKFGLTYDAFKESYDSVMDDVNPSKKDNTMLFVGIGVGAVAVVAVAAVAFMMLRKR